MTEFRELKNPEDARDAYRRQQAADAELSAAIAEANKDAVRRLRDLAPDRPFEIGGEALSAENQAADIRKRADGLRKLSGMKDAEVPWDRIVTSLKNQLVQEEELLIRATDESENFEAYNIPESDAHFRMLRQSARVDAYQAALDEIEKKVPKPKAGARGKAASGGDGS